VGALQNAQSNALVAGLMILSVVALERGRTAGGVAAVVAGATIKVFPLGAGLFGLLTPAWRRHIAWCAVFGFGSIALPLLVTSPALLRGQYDGWLAVQQQDGAKVGMAWLGGIVEIVLGRAIPHAPVQLAGIGWMMLSAWMARAQWTNPPVRRLLLASLLVFAVVFNHMAESPSFVIAFAGVGIWWATMPRESWRDALVAVIVLLGSVGGSDIVPKHIRLDWHAHYQIKAVVTVVGWFALQLDLFRYLREGTSGSTTHWPNVPTQPAR
jgi:hypothetical protein